MPCNPLLKEAFKGIEFEHKLDRVIAELPSTIKFDSNDMYKYLTKPKIGISPKEIEASGIMDMYKGDYKFSAKDWQEDFKHKGHLSDVEVTGQEAFGDLTEVTLGKAGEGNPTYKETMILSPRKPGDPKVLRHYNKSNSISKTNLGWRRVHIDNINGKDTTVLNEFQSDWLQYERDGYGKFRSKSKAGEEKANNLLKDKLKDKSELLLKNMRELDVGSILKPNKTNKAKYMDMERERNLVLQEIDNIGNIINDFQMAPKKYHQLQIVKAINESIKNGTNRVAIPIERETELAGSHKVTEFYDSLNKSILPDIRKKLDKQGLRIKLSKEKYNPDNSIWDKLLEKTDDEKYSYLKGQEPDGLYDVISEEFEDLGYNFPDSLGDGSFDEELDYMFSQLRDNNPDELRSLLDSNIDGMMEVMGDNVSPNTLHVIEIEEKPNTKVSWDYYGIMSALGLEKYAEGEDDGL